MWNAPHEGACEIANARAPPISGLPLQTRKYTDIVQTTEEAVATIPRMICSSKIRYVVIAFAMLIASVTVKTWAQTSAPATMDAHRVIENMTARNGSLHSFAAQLQVSGRMTTFPFLGAKLDGKYVFKQPNTYEVIFGHNSRYADAITRLLVEIANPSLWESVRNVVVDPQPYTVDGHNVIRLRLTPKTSDDKLTYALASVDPATYDLEEMEWHYEDGSSVVVDQTYNTLGRYRVLASQHAYLHFPGVRAVADAQYTDYETNVNVDSSSFATNK